MPLWVTAACGSAGKPEVAADQALASHPIVLELSPTVLHSCAESHSQHVLRMAQQSAVGLERSSFPRILLPISICHSREHQSLDQQALDKSHPGLPTQRGQNFSLMATSSLSHHLPPPSP